MAFLFVFVRCRVSFHTRGVKMREGTKKLATETPSDPRETRGGFTRPELGRRRTATAATAASRLLYAVLTIAMCFAMSSTTCEGAPGAGVNSFPSEQGTLHREGSRPRTAAVNSATTPPSLSSTGSSRRTLLEIVDPTGEDDVDGATADATKEKQESDGGDGSHGVKDVAETADDGGRSTKTKRKPAAAPSLRRKAARRKGRREVDYDALVGDATDDSVEVVMPKSPGDDGVPSWHPAHKKRQVRSQGSGPDEEEREGAAAAKSAKAKEKSRGTA